MSDKRREERIPLDKLPDVLKNIVFSTGFFSEYSGTTINASLNGFCLYVEKGENLKNKVEAGDKINIIIYPEKIKLKARVIYMKESPTGVSLGIQLLKTSKEMYQDLLSAQ